MKMRLKGAQKGHSLLKKKADALTLRFRQILGKIIEVSVIPHSCLLLQSRVRQASESELKIACDSLAQTVSTSVKYAFV